MTLPIGYENYIPAEKILAIINPDSSPAKKLRKEAEERGMLINATSGRKTRTIILLISSHIVLSALQPKTITTRYNALMVRRGKRDKEQIPQSYLGESNEEF